MKFKTYKGQQLAGPVMITIKIDGVRAECRYGTGPRAAVVSKSGKPLYNIPVGGNWTHAEIYMGSWEATTSAVRTHAARHIPRSAVYPLLPRLDKRLMLGTLHNPDADQIKRIYEWARARGYEGLVLRHIQPDGSIKWYRKKPVETYDVRVTSVHEGKGKYKGMLGKLGTARGGVGGGYTDAQRKEFWKRGVSMIGVMIEVRCSGLTPSGKFREPRFVRVRWDK